MTQNPRKPAYYFRHGVITLSAALALMMTSVTQVSAQEILFTTGQLVGDNVGSFQISPDGTQVAFVGSLEGTTDGQRTFVGGVTPGPDLGTGNGDPDPRFGSNAITEITPTNSFDVDDGLRWTPDGLSVITRYDVNNNNDNEYYAVPADGSANSGTTVPQQLTFGSNNAFDVQVSGDGSRIFYGDDRPGAMGTLLTTPIAGASASSAIVLNPSNAMGEAIAEIDTGSYVQAGSDIIFGGFATPIISPGNADREDTLYRTAADGSTANSPSTIPINNFPTDAALNLFDLRVTPDGETLVIRGDLREDGVTELFSLSTDGGDLEPLFTPPAARGGSFDVNPVYTISNDGTLVAFVSDFLTDTVGQLFIVDITGGTPRLVSDAANFLNLDGTASNLDVAFNLPPRVQFSADDQFLYYVADGGSEGNHNSTFTLHRVSVAAAIPEPGSLALLALGGLTLGFRRRRS